MICWSSSIRFVYAFKMERGTDSVLSKIGRFFDLVLAD